MKQLCLSLPHWLCVLDYCVLWGKNQTLAKSRKYQEHQEHSLGLFVGQRLMHFSKNHTHLLNLSLFLFQLRNEKITLLRR